MEIASSMLELGNFPVNKANYDEIRECFGTFGLTPNQVKVFFYLGKIGQRSASDIAKAVNIPRSETYHLLTALQNKGIVSATFEHPIKFSTVSIQDAIHVLVSTETERLKKLKISGPILQELWEKIPGFVNESEGEEEKFQVLQGGNQVNSKIFDMILNTKSEFRILGSEKDMVKFYHANFFEALEKRAIDYKILSPISKRSQHIFENMDSTKIKELCSAVKDNLCFIIKDNDQVLFFIKNSTGNNKEMRAIFTNSETIIYSKSLLFNNYWSNESVGDSN
jgi:sugar-specific transcriptional regulator TrmB